MEGSLTPGAAGGLLLRHADGLPAAHTGHLIPAWELRIADFARHLSLSAGDRTRRSYLDVLHRLVAFGVDPLDAERSDLERRGAPNPGMPVKTARG
ncbi:MAG: hypothetical protein J2P45_14345 [Candidatus Dormibacteraeota bacterium]|nr:hypothetical protein [Candidatus Dormibacteraeota bacterium]